MLEVFARYLSNAWKRLEIMSEFQQVRDRELALDRRELAEILLAGKVGSGSSGSQEELRKLAQNVGLDRFPDRVLLLRLQPAPEDTSDSTPATLAAESSVAAISTHLTMVRVAHLIEDRCKSWPNTLGTVVTPGEMCVFTAQKSRSPRS